MKSSGAPARSSASATKNRASNRRGRPGGVIARNTSRSAATFGTSPAAKNPRQAPGAATRRGGGIRPAQHQPGLLPQFANRGERQGAADAWVGVAQQPGIGGGPGGSAAASATSSGSTAPPGNTNLSGMNTAAAPRWPIRTRGAPALAAHHDHRRRVADRHVL